MNKLSAQAAQQDLPEIRLAALRTAHSIQALHRKTQRELVEAKRELERRAHALSATVSLLNAALESSPDGLVVVDLSYRVVAHNRRYVALWGLPVELMAHDDGLALTRFVASQFRDPVAFEARVRALRQQPEAELFDTFELRDGRTFERYVSPQRIDQRCVGTVIAWRDITERRQADALRVAKEVAEAANRGKSAFVSRMSHELRTPLNAILGFSEVLMMGGPQTLAAPQQQQVERIHAAGGHLLLLIEDLLDVSRLDSDAMAVRSDAVDAAASVHDAVRSLQSMADLRGVSLAVDADLAPGACQVQADRTRLQQVLLNLLSNAIKYNRTGGSVQVRLQPVAGRLRIEVVDDGIGLDPLQLQGLFQPFNRLGREHTAVPGTGIGLVISRKLVELMGGTLEVRSVPQQGSVFSFELPSAERPQPAARPVTAALARGPVLRREVTGRVLYIDDDEVNRLLMQALLAFRPGVVLQLAVDGASGIAAAQQAPPDLLLIDMRLPDIGGLQVLQALRAWPPGQGLPCVAVSANAMPEEIAEALRSGFDGYITKPLVVDRLLAEVDRVLAPPT